MEECANGMGQRSKSNCAAFKGANINLKRVDCAEGMVEDEKRVYVRKLNRNMFIRVIL